MDPIGRLPPATLARRSGAASGAAREAGFALPAGRPAAPAAAVPLGGLLVLQEQAVEPPADREARRRGRAILVELAALQRDLLADGVDAGRLHRLRALAEEGQLPPTHPALRTALDAVVLRARIELARFGET
ncbi:MAG TPA: flagellar assembly protein FliX [Acetobacteraceae bacterium]|nr:flagellar assembly protein FliX [Acetobacteraceae bacterium]